MLRKNNTPTSEKNIHRFVTEFIDQHSGALFISGPSERVFH